jgi:hypothetical protein
MNAVHPRRCVPVERRSSVREGNDPLRVAGSRHLGPVGADGQGGHAPVVGDVAASSISEATSRSRRWRAISSSSAFLVRSTKPRLTADFAVDRPAVWPRSGRAGLQAPKLQPDVRQAALREHLRGRSSTYPRLLRCDGATSGAWSSCLVNWRSNTAGGPSGRGWRP